MGHIMKHECYVDGKRLLAKTDLSFDNFGSEWIEEPVLDSVFPVEVKLREILSGKVTFLGLTDNYVNDPIDFLDALGFRLTYLYYDTATSSLTVSDVYDASKIVSGSDEICTPKIPIELRQVEATADIDIDSNGTSTELAVAFTAPSEELLSIKLKLREASQGVVTGMSVEIHADNAGSPAVAKLTGSNTLTPTFDPANGATYASAGWVSIDLSTLLNTATITPGTKYWLVFISTDTDPLYISYTASTNARMNGAVKAKQTGAWATVTGIGDLTFILQGQHTYGGHTLVFKSTDTDGNVRTVTARGTRIRVVPPSLSSQKVTQIGFDFTSYDFSITYT